MNYTGERMIPWNLSCGVHVMYHHIARYAWAIPWVFGKRVVDLGCGTGYGSFMLSWGAKAVTGVEISKDAVDFAKAIFKAGNLEFEQGDITRKVYPADIYVAFEVLEHLLYPEKIRDRYRPLIWSIPVSVPNPFHVRTYTVAEIDRLLGVGEWFQGKDGLIVRREVAWFEPAYVLGITR